MWGPAFNPFYKLKLLAFLAIASRLLEQLGITKQGKLVIRKTKNFGNYWKLRGTANNGSKRDRELRGSCTTPEDLSGHMASVLIHTHCSSPTVCATVQDVLCFCWGRPTSMIWSWEDKALCPPMGEPLVSHMGKIVQGSIRSSPMAGTAWWVWCAVGCIKAEQMTITVHQSRHYRNTCRGQGVRLTAGRIRKGPLFVIITERLFTSDAMQCTDGFKVCKTLKTGRREAGIAAIWSNYVQYWQYCTYKLYIIDRLSNALQQLSMRVVIRYGMQGLAPGRYLAVQENENNLPCFSFLSSDDRRPCWPSMSWIFHPGGSKLWEFCSIFEATAVSVV